MSSSDRNVVSCSSSSSIDQRLPLHEINLLASPASQRLQAFMDVYRHISTFDIKWETNLIAIPEASHEQIQNLIRRKSDYPKVQEALQSMELGDGPYLEITIEDNQSDKYTHVILAHGRTNTGVRRIAICEFRQCSGISGGGLMGTMAACGVIGYFNPAVAILAFIAKVAADYAISKQDVSVIVAIKELVRAGFLRLDETTMRIQLA
ncbi:unnamed protein product [Rotaria sp. Silwood2]|nr:unnamed protein product [Rotaria sp. Silwood2]